MKLHSFDISSLNETPIVPQYEEMEKTNWRAPAAKIRDICVIVEARAAALYYLTNDSRYKILREATFATPALAAAKWLPEIEQHSWYKPDEREFFKKVVQNLKEASKNIG